MNRYGNCSDENILELVNKSKNINTKEATDNWMVAYLRWAGAKGSCPLNLWMSSCKHFMLTFIKNGQDYETNSLAVIQASFRETPQRMRL